MTFKCLDCDKEKTVYSWRSSEPVICECGTEMIYQRQAGQGYSNVPKAKLQDGRPVIEKEKTNKCRNN